MPDCIIARQEVWKNRLPTETLLQEVVFMELMSFYSLL